jgi:RNA polymerase-binding transcription factor DksA
MLNPQQIETYRRRLQELARRHDADLASLRGETAHGVGGESGGNLSNAPHHEADLGTAHHEEEVGLLLLENQERLLAECNAALARITAGTYGLCERCSKEIPTERLDAFPDARYCVRCAERVERVDGPFEPAGDSGRP